MRLSNATSHCYPDKVPDSPKQNWSSASDEEVRAHLQSELERVRSADDTGAILGFSDPADLRKSFLSATKTYHPNRFARRPADIRALSGELYILLKEAHERGTIERTDQTLKMAKAAAQPPKSRARRPSPGGSGSYDSGARKALADRRRQQLKQRLSGTSGEIEQPRRTAQVRAVSASDLKSGAVDTAELEEARFKQAKEALAAQKLASAAAEFKDLAVRRPQDKRFRMYMHYAQGLQHLQGHAIEKAKSEFKRALGLDANFEPALEAMSSLAQDEKKKSGFFSKLFGK